MDRYTLFVDESGDFETQRGEWVVSGVLFDSDLENVLKKLDSALGPLVDKFDVADKTEFHLTEFRKDVGDKEAIERAEVLFSTLRKTNLNFHLLSVINEKKDSLSTPERTYRAMLTDLLAMLDSVIPHLDEIKQLELVVATRTINGVRTTTFRDIVTDIIGSLPKYFEYDLISSGFVHLLQKNRIVVKQDVAVRNWGLICADFISNITYHRQKDSEKILLAALSTQNLYSSFVAFGNLQERRSRIAERNGDLVLAIERWLDVYVKAEKEKTGEIEEEITNLLRKLHYKSFGSTEYELGLAAVVDQIWRQSSSDEDRLKCLRVIKRCILKQEEDRRDIPSVLEVFHIRTLTLMLFNQVADVETAKKIRDSQRKAARKLLALPEFLSLYLDFRRIATEILLNDLDYKGALSIAEQYSTMVDKFSHLLPAEIIDEEIVKRSEIWVVKECFVIRVLLLAGDLTNPELSKNIAERLETLTKTATESLHSRVSCLMLHYLLKTGQPGRAVDYLIENVDRPVVGPYLLFRALMTRNEYVTAFSQDDKVKTLTDFINLHLASLKPDTKGIPNSLIWREYSRWKWIGENNPGEAGKYIRHARMALNLKPSKFTALLTEMNDVYCSHIGQKAEKYQEKEERFTC